MSCQTEVWYNLAISANYFLHQLRVNPKAIRSISIYTLHYSIIRRINKPKGSGIGHVTGANNLPRAF
jgi:hypothetical protein